MVTLHSRGQRLFLVNDAGVIDYPNGKYFNRTPIMCKDTSVQNKTITLYEIIQENTFITQNALAIKEKT